MKRVTNLKNRDGDVCIECNAIMTWVNYLAYNDNIKKLGFVCRRAVAEIPESSEGSEATENQKL